jgi:anti-sigma B factor antagonist
MVEETPAEAPFDVAVEPAGDHVRVVIAGEVDFANAARLSAALERADRSSGQNIVLDLADLTFIDSTGLRELVSAARTARRYGRRIVAVNASHHIQRLFELTAIDKTIDVAKSPA